MISTKKIKKHLRGNMPYGGKFGQIGRKFGQTGRTFGQTGGKF